MRAVVEILEGLFTAGVIGSAVVVILTSIEDSEVLFSRNHQSSSSGPSERPDSEPQA